MERLTHPRNNGIKTGHWSPNRKEELVERLAEYENTGLTPQEIYSLKARDILRAEEMSILLRQCEDGTWEEKPEPYAVIECDTEEDFNRINQSLEATRWIPVKERLPENDNFVLVTVSGLYNHLIFSDAIQLGSYDGDWFIEGYPEWEDPEVVAWLPLLKPYRPERAEN